MKLIAKMIKTKRVYDPPEKSDGRRILIMRNWPRGAGYEKNKIDLSYKKLKLKDLGPPDKLLKKWNRGQIAWSQYVKEYFVYIHTEPKVKPLIDWIAELARKETVTLLCKCKSDTECHRYLLKPIIEEKLKESLS